MTDAPASDRELVARTRAGDEAAYGILVRRHYRAALAVALAHAGEVADAEDVCHDAFIRAAVHLDQCRNPDRFTAWLFTIVRNTAHNARDRARVRRAEPLQHETAAAGDDPARRVERLETRTRLLAALQEISPVQREVVILHDLEGWAHDDIAASLGISVVNSRQHLFQARRRLRAFLGTTTSRDEPHG